MTKQHYKVLKYIHKHQPIRKSDVLKKFPDFEKYLTHISEYLDIEDQNKDIQKSVESQLVKEAKELGLNVGETSEYIQSYMPNDNPNDSYIFYSTKLLFQEYLEKKRHDAWLFWFPYIITTIIAIASLIAQFCTN